MILRRKILTLSKVNNVLTKQQDQLNYHLNKNTFRQFSAYSLERSKVVGMATYSDVNVSHNSKLSSKNQLHDQRYSVVGKIPYSSGLEQVDSAEKQRYDASAYLKSSQSDQKVDPKKVEKWVKEAMEVEHEGYDKVLTSYVQNVDAVVTFYKHKATGLTVVSFRTSDKNKEMAFDVSAPTYQFNDHGCTHVTEHSVLIKTEDYKVFNSFYYQVAGMYYSFLNALYYKNRTRYYFTSLNEKSFYQLADQFMSAFFKPSFLKDEDIVKQEGWHYKVTKSNEKDSNTKEVGVDVHGRHVTFSGVVYNEMKKRTYANPVDKGVSVLDHNLFTNTLRYDSGGNPEDIVDLTHQELVDFYNMFYGPSTATVYFHGANDVYKRLDFVDKYLKKHNLGVSPDPKTGKYSHTASPEFVKQISVHEEYKEAPKYVKTQYSAQNKDEDVMMMGWVLDPKYKGTNKYDLDSVDKLAFEVVKHMLLDSHNSVFQKALVESELGSRVVGPGLDDFYPLYPHVTFMFGVEGVKYTEKTREENVKKFEQQVFKALKDVVEKGFDREAVKSALSKVEFKHTEQNYVMKEHRQGYYPKGLTQLRFVQPQLEQGKDPLEFVRLDKLMAELKNRVSKDRNYLSNLVKKHMLNNTTRVTMHMEAVESKEYEKEFNKKVVEKLKSRLSHLSKEEVDKLEEEYKKFKEEREKRQDGKAYESFPEFDPKEVLKKDSKDQKKVYKLSESSLKEQSSLKRSHPDSKESEVTVLSNKVDSNGILYMDYTLALDSLSLDDLKYMYLFSQMLQEAGTDKLTPEEVSYLVDKNLGGVSFSTYFTTESNNQTYDDPTKGLGYLVVRSKSLKHKTDQMVDVVHDLLVNANFSNSKKGVMLVKRSVKQLEYSLRDLAHVFTFRRLSKRFSVANYADEVANGYSQLVFLRDELVPLAEKDWSKVESKLNEIRQKLMNMKNLTVNLTGDQELLDSFLKNATQYHSKLTSTFKSGQQKTQTKVWVEEVLKNKLLESTNKDELIVLPLRNNFVGVGGKLFSKNDKKSGEHSVAMHYLMRTYLYRFLRTSGGAYGAHVYLTNTGHVAMVSYADPNFMSTLEVYKKVPEGLKEASDWLSEKGMKMHVVGTLSSLDRQHNPEDKAKYVMKSYLRGETDEQIQKLREQVVSASKKVFKEVEAKFRESKDWMTVSSLVNRESAESAPSHYKKLF